jgi:hypothetical protein
VAKIYDIETWGLYYKILRIRNARQMDSKLVSFILLVTSTLALTNTLAYFAILTLQIYYVQQTDRFRNKLVPYIIDHKHINSDKHTSLLRNPYFTNQ